MKYILVIFFLIFTHTYSSASEKECYVEESNCRYVEVNCREELTNCKEMCVQERCFDFKEEGKNCICIKKEKKNCKSSEQVCDRERVCDEDLICNKAPEEIKQE